MRQGLLVKIEILYLHLVIVRSLLLILILNKNASHGFSLQSSHFFEFGVLYIFIYHCLSLSLDVESKCPA